MSKRLNADDMGGVRTALEALDTANFDHGVTFVGTVEVSSGDAFRVEVRDDKHCIVLADDRPEPEHKSAAQTSTDLDRSGLSETITGHNVCGLFFAAGQGAQHVCGRRRGHPTRDEDGIGHADNEPGDEPLSRTEHVALVREAVENFLSSTKREPGVSNGEALPIARRLKQLSDIMYVIEFEGLLDNVNDVQAMRELLDTKIGRVLGLEDGPVKTDDQTTSRSIVDAEQTAEIALSLIGRRGMSSSRFVNELRWLHQYLDQLATDASDCGETAVHDKVMEALGPLDSARTAAEQYVTGELTNEDDK